MTYISSQLFYEEKEKVKFEMNFYLEMSLKPLKLH